MRRNSIILFFLSFVLLGIISAQNDYKKEFNIGSETDIIISEAGKYLIYSDDYDLFENSIFVDDDISDPVFITLRNVFVKPSSGSAMIIGANTTVNLLLEGEENSLTGSGTGCGIEVIGSIIISGEITSTLSCQGGGRAAAIGTTGSSPTAGEITINGGTIIAKSGAESAAIGASNGGHMGDVIINGGVVRAMGGAYASAIGAAYVSKGSASITINGGTIYAQAGIYSSNNSIGKGNGTGTKITTIVNGGNIIALDDKGNYGGVLNPAPLNNEEEFLELFEYTINDIYEPTRVYSGSVGSYVLGVDYGLNDVWTTDDGTVCFYLPEEHIGGSVGLNTVSGLKDSSSKKTKILIQDQTLIIHNAANSEVLITDFLGRVILNTILHTDTEQFTLDKDKYYIVKVSDQVFKALIR